MDINSNNTNISTSPTPNINTNNEIPMDLYNKSTGHKNKIPILGIIIAILISLTITFFKTNDVFGRTKVPIVAYQVYLKGESIGLIRNDKELYNYINKMQKN